MATTIKHARGRRSTWLSKNPVLPDGVIALSMESGGYSIVVGDGSTHFSELKGTRPNIINGYSDYVVEHTLSDNEDVRLGETEDLFIKFPSNPKMDFTAMVTFFCGEYGTMFSYPSDTKILFSGADVENREFYPSAFTRYTLFFWYDGVMQCHVRGVYYDYDD